MEEVQKTVYSRMIAERKQIAEKFRSEGRGETLKIEGDRERDLKQITSEAYNKDPDFYSFVKTLDIYRKTMNKDSCLILSTDSDFLKYFKGYKGKEWKPNMINPKTRRRKNACV